MLTKVMALSFITAVLFGCGQSTRKTILLTDPATGCYYITTIYGDKFMDPPPVVRAITNPQGLPVCKKN